MQRQSEVRRQVPSVRNCTKGKKCGRSCIVHGEICHRTQGQSLLPGTLCKRGQPCGNTCISLRQVCRRGHGSAQGANIIDPRILAWIKKNTSIQVDPTDADFIIPTCPPRTGFTRSFTGVEEYAINQALYKRGPPDQVITQIGTDSIQLGSFRRLLPGQWLNDEVIHFFTTVLSKRDEFLCTQDVNRKRCHFFKSFFITKLTNEGHFDPQVRGTYEYRNVRRWTSSVPGRDLFQLEKVFFPINVGGNHWVCAVAYIQERKIQFYDSLGSSGARYLQHIWRYLQDEHMDKKQHALPGPAWKLVPCNIDRTPQQLNGYDCGVFVCMFMDLLATDCPLLFNQHQIPQCRKRIALSILKGTAVA